MKATDIKMYISTLSIIKKGQEIETQNFELKEVPISMFHFMLRPYGLFIASHKFNPSILK